MADDDGPMDEARLVLLRSRIETSIGNEETRNKLMATVDSLMKLPTNTIRAEVLHLEGELNQRRWVPIVTAFFVALAGLGVIGYTFPSAGSTFTILGFNIVLVLTGATGGFLGSFVRVVTRAVNSEYFGMGTRTVIAVAITRPLVGASLGIFLMAAFASGVVGMPIGDAETIVVAGVTKAHGFIFAAAFTAGLVDEFVTNLAARFTNLARAST